MPVNFLGSLAFEGTKSVPYWDQIVKYGPWVLTTGLVKRYFSGATNTWERGMHGRVVIVTGGTSGLGAAVVRHLARSGAQIILLVRKIDEWTTEYVDQLREESGNALIYVEKADLADFMSVRKFATKWLDNSPPRRLDMIICCAATALPPTVPRQASEDGLEAHLQVNYLGHYHLLTLLSPSIRAQPPDRDVRIILTSCVSAVMGSIDVTDLEYTKRGYPRMSPYRIMGSSKLALTMFGYEFHKRTIAYERPDKAPNNIHLAIVDPGMMRSPSFKRFFSMGSILGLIIYVLLWPLWWLFLKTSNDGAQSILYAAMAPAVVEGEGPEFATKYISDCTIRSKPPRKELEDAELQKSLFDVSGKIIEKAELESVKRAKLAEKDTKPSSGKPTTKPANKPTTSARNPSKQPTKRKT